MLDEHKITSDRGVRLGAPLLGIWTSLRIRRVFWRFGKKLLIGCCLFQTRFFHFHILRFSNQYLIRLWVADKLNKGNSHTVSFRRWPRERCQHKTGVYNGYIDGLTRRHSVFKEESPHILCQSMFYVRPRQTYK